MAVRIIKNAWYVDFRFRRKRYRRKSPKNSMAGARAYEFLLVSRLNKGESIDDNEIKEKISKFSLYVQGWLKTYVRNNNKPSEQYKKGRIVQKHLNPFFGNIPIDKITHHKIEEYKATKIDKQKPKTTNNQLAVLSKCLRCAYEEFDIEGKFPKIIMNKIVDQEPVYLSVEESERLIKYADGIWKDMILVALKTGLRIGELLALDWNDINFINKTVTVRRSMYRGSPGPTKNYKIRVVPLTDDVFRALAERNNKTGFVFSDENGKSLNHDRANRNIHRICRVAEVKDITFHNLRHSFCSHLTAVGISRRVISDLMGHGSEKMTRKYAHLSPNSFESAINNLKLTNFNEIFGHYVGTGEDVLVKTKKRKQEYESNFRNFVR